MQSSNHSKKNKNTNLVKHIITMRTVFLWQLIKQYIHMGKHGETALFRYFISHGKLADIA